MTKLLAKCISVTAVVLISLTTGACANNSHSPSVAALSASATSAASGANPSSGAKPTTARSALAYSQCMRKHGIGDFPDPGADGQLALNAQPGSDIDPDNATYKAADKACKSLLPPQQAPPAGLYTANLKYAKCMRSHAISDFPDPHADGSLQVQAKPGSDLSPDNPQYKKADAACKKFLLNGGAGGGLSQNTNP